MPPNVINTQSYETETMVAKWAKIGRQMGKNCRPRLIFYVFNSLIKLWPPSLPFFNKTSATKFSIL